MIYWDILLDSEDVPGTLRKLYEHAQSIHGIAGFLGVSVSALRRELRRNAIPIRNLGDNLPKRKFEHTDNPLLDRYTTWVLRQRGINMARRHEVRKVKIPPMQLEQNRKAIEEEKNVQD
jgi:hypothetical protein